ncbi:MAG: TfoX/Sxy family protein [Candidatus Puniceispirillaceae bacterium]|jgi:hypothetical protein
MYDAGLAERLHDLVGGMFEMELATMFGGYGFLMNGHMCVFIWGDRLVIRIGEAAANAIANQPHVGPMDLTGRRMRGWATITHEGVAEDAALQRYVDMAILFCATLPPKEAKPKARGSRKTTRKPN